MTFVTFMNIIETLRKFSKQFFFGPKPLNTMPKDRSGLKSKLFLSTADKDEVSKKRNKADFELSEDVTENLPKYSPEMVLNSFRERQENADKRFFGKRWEVLKRNIVGQTMWVTISYFLIYYFIQILFVQQTINTSSWFSRDPSRDGDLSNPSCITDFCKCCRSVNVTTTDFSGTCSDLKTPSFEYHSIVDRCIEAKQVAKLVASYETKQSRLVNSIAHFPIQLKNVSLKCFITKCIVIYFVASPNF